MTWGPTPVASASYAPGSRRLGGSAAKGGTYWHVYAILLSCAVPFLIGAAIVLVTGAHCPSGTEGTAACTNQRDGYSSVLLLVQIFMGVTGAVGLILGLLDGRRRRPFASGRTGSLIVVTVLAAWSVVAYAIGYGVGRAARPARLRQQQALIPTNTLEKVAVAPDPLAAIVEAASRPFGLPGAHLGWTPQHEHITARPRGGVLIIGPPGSGKSSAVIIPSVMIAPGACVASSIKGDVMAATAVVRARQGKLWHFDPGGDEQPAVGVQPCRWSPLAGVRSWDDARRIASRMAEPARQAGDANGGHFLDRARDWLEVLLFAAHLDERPIGDMADWAATADSDSTAETVLAILLPAADAGDPGARIARTNLEGLLSTPDRERGSVMSTLTRLLRIYGSVSAREIGEHPNFSSADFVRSTDTLYITAGPDRQNEYAPLIAALLEEIRYAVYARHRAEEAHAEPARPHVTFVLDEANNTAPIPLPAVISEAGGQSLHVIVGIQDLSRARGRWGKDADGFLTLFPTKLILPGVVEPYTLDALSNAAGEFDRLMIGHSESTSHIGPYSIPIRQVNPSYSIHRQKVLHQGDIANLPLGTGLLFEGAQWHLINIGMHWQHSVWRAVTWHAEFSRFSDQPTLRASHPEQ